MCLPDPYATLTDTNEGQSRASSHSSEGTTGRGAAGRGGRRARVSSPSISSPHNGREHTATSRRPSLAPVVGRDRPGTDPQTARGTHREAHAVVVVTQSRFARRRGHDFSIFFQVAR